MVTTDTVTEYAIVNKECSSRVFLSDTPTGGQLTIVNKDFFVSQFIPTKGTYIKELLVSFQWEDIANTLGFQLKYSHKRTVDAIEEKTIFAATENEITAKEYHELGQSIEQLRDISPSGIDGLEMVIQRAFPELLPYFNKETDFRAKMNHHTEILLKNIWIPLKRQLRKELALYCESDEGIPTEETLN